MSILDLELRAKYSSKTEAAKARGWTLKQVSIALRIGVLLPVVLPVDRKGALRPRRR
jgi:hypothetical protein